MKKLMVSTIILLPLIILAILLVSGAIMSMVTHIYVESVEFVKNDMLVLVMPDESAPPTYDLGAEITILPLRSSERGLLYKSADESLVKVDENGILTAVSYGETSVTVVSKENVAATATRKVRVTDSSVHMLEMNEGYETELYEGETTKFSVRILPAEAENKLVHWESSDPSILKVSANGTATAVGAGEATVTAVSDDNEAIKAAATVKCYKKIVDLETDAIRVVTSRAVAKFPAARPVPEDAYCTLAYTSSDEKIATVDEKGNIMFHKEGLVTISVAATDFGGKTITKTKDYVSTFGYFIGPLFAEKTFTADYDEYEHETLPISFTADPDGESYRKVERVEYSIENVLDFSEKDLAFKFKGLMPEGAKEVEVTVFATVYDPKTNALTAEYEDGFTLYVTRKATKVNVTHRGESVATLQTSQSEITFSTSEADGSSVVNVAAEPSNHTDAPIYSLAEPCECATLEGGVLKFSKEGSAKVKIAYASEGEEHASSELTVNYVEIRTGDRTVDFTGSEKKNAELVLQMPRTSAEPDKGVILINSDEGTRLSYEVVEGQDIVELVDPKGSGSWNIKAKKGGFAKVEIKSTSETLSAICAGDVWTIDVYVDRPVQVEDFQVTFNEKTPEGFRTSLESVKYKVIVNDNNGSTAGKCLHVSYGDAAEVKEENVLEASGNANFGVKNDITFTFAMKYSEKVFADYREKSDTVGEQTVTKTATTTHGKLDKAPTVKYNGSELKENTDFTIDFANIDETAKIEIIEKFQPEDFELSKHLPEIEGTAYVDAEVDPSGTFVTLTARKRVSSNKLILSIGGKTFPIAVSVKAKADTLALTCGETKLNDKETYETLLQSLTFTPEISRKKDTEDFDDKQIEYKVGEAAVEWTQSQNHTPVTIELTEDTTEIFFRSHDQGVTFKITVNKATLSDFGMQVTYEDSKGTTYTLGDVASAKENRSLSYVFPSDVKNAFTVKISHEDGYLGGLGGDEEFKDLFKLALPAEDGWQSDYDAGSKEITVTFTEKKFSAREVKLTCGEISVTIMLSRVVLQSIEFVGYNSTVKEQVYLGYQQVQVFAKKSSYGGNTVDYFKIPYLAYGNSATKVEADPDELVWTIDSVKEQGEGTNVTKQIGKSVTYGDETYTIAQEGEEWVLKKEDTIVSGQDGTNPQNIPWVDTYSEKGYARIYFGDIKGLSEVDVQNDYFGNFGEMPEWSKKEADGDTSGRDFTPSVNAYSFVKITAGDGVESGTNCHFNFNLLEDNTVVNVVDAQGYFNKDNRKIVLHNNLYGDGELSGEQATKAQTDGLILNPTDSDFTEQNDSRITKDLIYGNGHSVNIKAANDKIVGKKLESDKENTGNSTPFGTLINVTLKGTNPTTTVTPLQQKIYFTLVGAYYSDIQYYSKLNPSGGKVYMKNTVLRYVSSAAIQLWNANQFAYLENVVMVECVKGISVEEQFFSKARNQHLYIKGFVDILNYHSRDGLKDRVNLLNGSGGMYVGYVHIPEQWGEWYGIDYNKINNYSIDKNRYLNVLVFLGRVPDTQYGEFIIHTWDGTKYVVDNNENCEVKLTMGLSMDLFDGIGFAGWTYDSKITSDGGVLEGDKASARKPEEYFSKDRDIRLLCQYKATDKDGNLIKNESHILWHTQKVYRDTSLIDGRDPDHIHHLVASLKEQDDRWDGTWAGGGSINDYDDDGHYIVN